MHGPRHAWPSLHGRVVRESVDGHPLEPVAVRVREEEHGLSPRVDGHVADGVDVYVPSTSSVSYCRV